MKLFPPLKTPLIRGGENETTYNIMFGPDICGSNKHTHFIMHYNGSNIEMNTKLDCLHDRLTHLYAFSLYNNGSYEVLIDNVRKASGTLRNDWSFLKPKIIDDPSVTKPIDWVTEELMDDPSDIKPEDWIKDREVPDPNAVIPEDWDVEDDGAWEPPMMTNPAYKGEWLPKKIANPSYKGPWVQPTIDNPEFYDDPNIGLFEFGAVGFEIWQVKAGSAFDSILITDDADEFSASVKKILALLVVEEEQFEKSKAEEAKNSESSEANGEANGDGVNTENEESVGTEEIPTSTDVKDEM